MLVSEVGFDLNWYLQIIFSFFVGIFALVYLVKNAATRYLQVDANFEGDQQPLFVNSNSITTPPDNNHSADRTDSLKMPGVIMEGNLYCFVCGKSSTKKCSSCKAVRYCSQECQHTHWTSGHKKECKVFDQANARDSDRTTVTNGGLKSSPCSSKYSSSIALVPSRGTSKVIKRPRKVLFPYGEFLKYFYWDKLKFSPCGLQNCGNSCFANVVLQCLTFTRPLVAFLLEEGHSKECRRNGWCFLCEFQSHVERTSRSSEVFSPMNILSRLPNIGGTLGYGSQEDAHEFMRFAIDTMQSVCLDEFGGEKAVDPSSQETTLIQHVFAGHLQSQVICTECNNISNQYENMLDLTVEIHGNAESLERCLDQFTVKECLQGENMYKCDGCNDYVKAWKRLTIKRAPNILTIALKRFQSGRFGKLNKRISFPETLDLSPYMSEAGDGSDIYKLYAVVVHLDMLNASYFGHYVCYIKDFQGNWYIIDDWKVERVELSDVLSQGVYMLLYSRVSARPSCLKGIEYLEEEKQMVKVKSGSCQKEEAVSVCFSPADVGTPCKDSVAVPSYGKPSLNVSVSEYDSSSCVESNPCKDKAGDIVAMNGEPFSPFSQGENCNFFKSSFSLSPNLVKQYQEDIHLSEARFSVLEGPSCHLQDLSVAFNSRAGSERRDDNVTQSGSSSPSTNGIPVDEENFCVPMECDGTIGDLVPMECDGTIGDLQVAGVSGYETSTCLDTVGEDHSNGCVGKESVSLLGDQGVDL